MDRRSFLAIGTASMAVPAFAQELPSVSVREAHAAARAGRLVIVDIRRPDEWAETGVAEGAVRLNMLDKDFPQRLVALKQQSGDKELALICRAANRTDYVQKAFAKHNFRLVNIRGGMSGNAEDEGWIDAGLPVTR
jgi:rhodanese-related sulfurtransferase